MIYPIYLFGSNVLRGVNQAINSDYPNLQQLIDDMFETMAMASGVGLAAPQIGLPIRLFCIDVTDWFDEIPEDGICRRVFINPEIYERFGESEKFNEGCLSLPGINEDVVRPTKIRIRYMDENFEIQDREFDDIWARVIQHEYDHIEGKVFTDHLAPIRKNMIKSKLQKLTKGEYKAKYRCKND